LTGDLATAEMNALELEMLWMLKFSLNVSREDYDACVGDLREIHRTIEAHQDQANASATPGLPHKPEQPRSQALAAKLAAAAPGSLCYHCPPPGPAHFEDTPPRRR
jgi:hypothetical protein